MTLRFGIYSVFRRLFTALGLFGIGLIGLGIASVAPYAQTSSVLKAKIRGADMGSYGRILLSLDQLPKHDISLKNGILIWRFDRELDLDPDRLSTELSNFVASARLDPDRKGLRLALQQPSLYNVQDAGTDLYLDVLPKSWKGAYPSLPPDIVRELSRRVREAEASLQKLQAKPRSDVIIDVANGKGLTLIKFSPFAENKTRVTPADDHIEILVDGAFHLDPDRFEQALPAEFKFRIEEQNDERLKLRIDHPAAFLARTYFDSGLFIVEFKKQKSGLLLDDLVKPSSHAGLTTGSIDQGGMPSGPVLSFRRNNEFLDFVIDNVLDTPRAIFQASGKMFIMIESDQDMIVPDMSKFADAPITAIDVVQMGPIKTVIARLRDENMPSLRLEDKSLTFRFSPDETAKIEPLDIVAHVNARDEARAMIALGDVSQIVSIEDPDTGYRYFVAPSRFANLGFSNMRMFQDFLVVPSWQGVAVRPAIDDLELRADAGVLSISRLSGQMALTRSENAKGDVNSASTPIIRAQSFKRLENSEYVSGLRRLQNRIAQAEPQDRAILHNQLARYYAAHDLFLEAVAAMDLVIEERGPGKAEPRDRLERAFYVSLAGRHSESLPVLLEAEYAASPEASLFLAFDHASLAKFDDAMAAYRRSQSVLAQYPASFVRKILPALAEAAIEARDIATASNLVTALQPYMQETESDHYRYLAGRVLDLSGKVDEAAEMYRSLGSTSDPSIEVRAKQALLLTEAETKRLSATERLSEYEGISLLWRGDWIEARTLVGIAAAAFEAGAYRRGFSALRELNWTYADVSGVRAMLDTASARLETFFDDAQPQPIGTVEAVSLFMEYREFAPVGRRGDELIRRLADRLIALDLLTQAADIMRYQLNNRLEGLAKAAAAPKLAYILILDRKPKDAMQILSDTRMNGMDEELKKITPSAGSAGARGSW